MRTELSILTVIALVTICASAAAAEAQFPTRPIRIVAHAGPGSAPDVAARLVGDRLSRALGQPVIVENKSGANGNIAGDYVVKSAADGYTLLIVPDSVITVNPHVYRKMPFDPLKDLVPVASIYQSQFILAVHPSVPAKTLPEFISLARQANPPLRYASTGPGSLHQLGIEMLKQRADIDLVHVPYRGGAAAGTATVAGETHVVLAGVGAVGLIQSGNLRALATTGNKHSALLSEVPPIAQFYPGYDLTAWGGIFAPTGTPEPIVSRLRAEIYKALADPDLVLKLSNTGPKPLVLSAQEFSALIQRDFEKYGTAVKAINLEIE